MVGIFFIFPVRCAYDSILVLLRVLAVLVVPVLAVTTGRNTASTLNTRVSPPSVTCFNSHLWDHPSTMNAVCNKIRMQWAKRRCTERWSEYASYFQYTALIESILVLLRVLAVFAVQVLAVPTGRNTVSIWRNPQYWPWNTWSTAVLNSIIQ